jgi:DNA-binding HxlR family transcriptional regulator
MLATALDRVGDRWTLLIVRDLIAGPQRFTDLADRLGGITPKTLSVRLRELETGGLVQVDRQPGRREVWYRLTDAGRDLYPALEELLVWSLHHALRLPEPGEPAHPEHILWALRVQLERERVDPGPVRWMVQLADDGIYVLRNDGPTWTVDVGGIDRPDVRVSATKDAWARFVACAPSMRSPEQLGVQLEGTRSAVRTFLKSIEAFPFGRASTASQVRRTASAASSGHS